MFFCVKKFFSLLDIRQQSRIRYGKEHIFVFHPQKIMKLMKVQSLRFQLIERPLV